MDMHLQEVMQILQTAIEASVYVAPTDFGLTHAELIEVGNRIGLKQGEITDALRWPNAYGQAPGRRYSLPEHLWQLRAVPHHHEDPDYRKIDAFDFVIDQLNQQVAEYGAAAATLPRDVIVERARASSIPAHDVQVALTLNLLSGFLTEDAGGVRFSRGGQRPLPSASLTMAATLPRLTRRDLARVYPVVKDVVERRIDGRPRNAEPFPAFAEALEKIGYPNFRLWWTQLTEELRTTAPSSPTSTVVLAAAVVEGSLTFVARYARDAGFGLFASKDFEGESTRWNLASLIGGATQGGSDAILDNTTRLRAESLIRTRQRIHAGRMLSEHPSGPPDLRPEEAREAKDVAQQVVRRILDWLETHPR
jgi:hypothetical protein